MEPIEQKLNKGIKDVKSLKMTWEEKAHMLSKITGHAASPKNRKIASPYLQHIFSYVMVAALVLVVSGGGMAYASLRTLPGNLLYPFKVKVVEPARGAFISSPEEKAFYASTLTSERLIEAETLSIEGRLDKKKSKSLRGLVEKHTGELDKALKEIKQNDKEDRTAKIIRKNIREEIKAHESMAQSLAAPAQEKSIAENKGTSLPESPELKSEMRSMNAFSASEIADETEEDKKGEDEDEEEIQKTVLDFFDSRFDKSGEERMRR